MKLKKLEQLQKKLIKRKKLSKEEEMILFLTEQLISLKRYIEQVDDTAKRAYLGPYYD